jgi:hypothetical protein
MAYADEFINGAEKYDTVVGEEVEVSGGKAKDSHSEGSP